MGGIFGVASKSDCVMDLFFGIDYHSHLGTRRGGMAVYGKNMGFNRVIHNIENSPFRTKFDKDVAEMEHRYYTGYDIQLFLNIKELKNRGLQLKAIRDLLPKISGCEADVRDTAEHQILEQKLSDEKVSLLEEKLSEKKEKDVEKEKESEKEETGDDKILEFQEILERLIAQELHAKKEGEDRWRSLDAAIRRQQLARKEAAAASDKKTKKNIKAHK